MARRFGDYINAIGQPALKRQWCNTPFHCDGGRKFNCRRPSGHPESHGCPAHEDICNRSDCLVSDPLTDEDMDYIRRSLGINIPEEGIIT